MSTPTFEWDVMPSLADLSFALAQHRRAQSVPDAAELEQWSDWVGRIGFALQPLILACEELVERPDRDRALLARLEKTLAAAQGQLEYSPRADRW